MIEVRTTVSKETITDARGERFSVKTDHHRVEVVIDGIIFRTSASSKDHALELAKRAALALGVIGP